MTGCYWPKAEVPESIKIIRSQAVSKWSLSGQKRPLGFAS